MAKCLPCDRYCIMQDGYKESKTFPAPKEIVMWKRQDEHTFIPNPRVSVKKTFDISLIKNVRLKKGSNYFYYQVFKGCCWGSNFWVLKDCDRYKKGSKVQAEMSGWIKVQSTRWAYLPHTEYVEGLIFIIWPGKSVNCPCKYTENILKEG